MQHLTEKIYLSLEIFSFSLMTCDFLYRNKLFLENLRFYISLWIKLGLKKKKTVKGKEKEELITRVF